VICASCGAENRAGRKFCAECGTPLAVGCPACGASNEPGEKFCGECGSALVEGASAAPSAVAPRTDAAASVAAIAERRLVSVLFADLVGFTTLSEARDSEEVRELLTKYFDTCRTIITRYGGVVEKFIGDAVMAVWGAPVATEDDAERAVRAALELTAAVAAMGEEAKAPELRARAGVLTGEAAVNIGAERQGMVAGDMVNTASRIQSAAEPGAVFVGESTKRSTDATIVFEPAGEHELKGKVGLTPLWRAIRVIAGARGTLKSTGLEPPFVGRDRELRLVKELFHASTDEGKAHLVSVTGIAGIGKSRLSWEFYKYFDGLERLHLYHRGRCISYGEGVAYWALAEMVKMRCRIAEEEGPTSAVAKLRSTLEEFVPDPEERAWVEPRLAHLLGLEERAAADKEDLFAAWRLFIERMAEQDPVVMIFEDLHWADAALLDFIEYLLEWSRNHPIFVLTLGRPELAERRPSWGAGKRNFTPVYLEALSEEPMGELLSGLVPGLPEDISAQILERAQGVPLYAVETVRMLLDRGLLHQEGNVYRPTGPIEKLEVPETLHALIAARLDGLAPEERRIVQDGAVLGKTFFKEALARVSGMGEPKVEEILGALVRKEVLSVQADPRSPERGQYGFLQDLLKTVAYETLSKHDRKAKHLAAAAFIEATWAADEDEIVEVLASHYLRAYEAVPDADDAAEYKARARDMLGKAGERAASLAANVEAQRYFEQAVELSDDDGERAGLLERAGRMAHYGTRYVEAVKLLEEAASIYKRIGEPRLHAAVSAALGETEWYGMAKIEGPLRRMEAAYEVLAQWEPDEALAALAGEIARFQYFAGHVDEVQVWVERALDIAEALWLPEVLSNVLNTKGLTRRSTHPEESFALLGRAVILAEENGSANALIRAINNLGVYLAEDDRTEEAIQAFRRQGEVAHRLGIEQAVLVSRSSVMACQVELGQWDDALEIAEELWPEQERAPRDVSDLTRLVLVHRAHGELQRGRAVIDAFASFDASEEAQMRVAFRAASACQLLAEGRADAAHIAAEPAIADAVVIGVNSDAAKWAYTFGMEAAAGLGDADRLQALIAEIDAVPRGLRSPHLGAQAARYRAHATAVSGDGDPTPAWETAAGTFREIGAAFWLAVTLLEHGEWLAKESREEQAATVLEEARTVFERLRATPWLERLEKLPLPAASAGGEAAS
jgi:class 3 adenylate cyclase/tetratricopeptide (TPR) repeat protein